MDEFRRCDPLLRMFRDSALLARMAPSRIEIGIGHGVVAALPLSRAEPAAAARKSSATDALAVRRSLRRQRRRIERAMAAMVRPSYLS